MFLVLIYSTTDFTQTVEEDFYPISNKTIDDCFDIIENHKVGAEGVWMTNSDSTSYIIIELYTDKHRIRTLHVTERFEYLLNEELRFYYKTSEHSYGLLESSKNDLFLNNFLNQAKSIPDSCFVSSQGYELYENNSHSKDLLGIPDSTYALDSIDVYVWEFNSLEYPESGDNGNGKFVKKGFGYDVTHYYWNEKLVMRVLFRHIP